MNRILILAVIGIMVVSSGASAQYVLTTTFAAGNGRSGNMFDIVATSSVVIQGFDVNLSAGSYTMEVYIVTGGGSFVGNEANSGAWTLLGSATATSTAQNVGTPLPLPLAVTIPAGTTQGFYVTLTGAGTLWYTNGTTLGAVFAQDQNIQFLEGIGLSYPFGSTYSPRIWNGNINYGLAGPPPFQLNVTSTPAGALTFDLQNLPLGVAEGWTFATADTSLPAGTGPFFGITPDPLAYLIFSAYPFPTVGHPFHWLAGFPGLHPAVPYSFPAGTTSGLSGVSVDFLSIALDSSFAITGFTNTARLTW